MSGWRRGAQLRREWQGPTRRLLRPHLDPAGGGRCRWLGWSGACRLSSVSLAKPRVNGVALDGMSGAYLGPAYKTTMRPQRRLRAGWSHLQVPSMTKRPFWARPQKRSRPAMPVGWFQGRMEFGPRALGARSILADPCSPTMQKVLNLKVKYRESFRPFAPAVLAEDASDWFAIDRESPYMLLVTKVKERRRRRVNSQEEKSFGIDRLNWRAARSRL